jgi:hypothetical protein
MIILKGYAHMVDCFIRFEWSKAEPHHGHYTIFKWIVLARPAKAKPVFLNVGAGLLARPLSKYFIRTALSLPILSRFETPDRPSLSAASASEALTSSLMQLRLKAR